MDCLTEYRGNAGVNVPPKMRALVLSGTGFENLSVREVPVPDPGPNQLLCRVDAAGVCTSILKIVAQGADHSYFNGWDPAKFPVILGDEGSLTVARVGRNLAGRYSIGQRFGIQPAVDTAPINYRDRYRNNAVGMVKCAVGYTLGGNLAQYILVQEEVMEAQCLLPLPNEDLPYFAVSMAEPVSCVVSAQDRHYHLHKDGPFAPRVPKLGLLAGGTAVVIGAGPMGLMHAELAIRYRPRNLIICDKIEQRLQRADKTLSEKARQAGVRLLTVKAGQLKETVMSASGGAGADDIILAVGIQAVQQAALELLGKGGVANLFGGLPKGQHILQINGIAVHYDEIKLVGSSGGAPSDMSATLDAFVASQIDPGNYVFGIGGLQHAPKVLAGIKDGKIEGKVILYPNADVAELEFVDYWDRSREEQFLRKHLRAILT